MAEQHGIVVGLDASSVDRGLSQMDRRLNTTLTSLDRFDKRASQVFSRLDQLAGKVDISKVSAQINGLVSASSGLDKASGAVDRLGASISRLSASSGNLARVSRDLTALSGSVQKVASSARSVSSASGAIDKLITTVSGRRVNTRGMDRVAESLRSMSAIQVDPRLAAHLGAVSSAMTGFKAPSKASVQNTQAFFNGLNNGVDPKVAQNLATLSAITGGFKAPSKAAVQNLNNFFSGLKTSFDPKVVQTLTSLSAASGTFRGPSAASVTQLSRLITVSSTASVNQINSLAGAINKLSAANSNLAASSPAFANALRGSQRAAQNPSGRAVQNARTPANRSHGQNSEMMLYGPLGGFSQMSGGGSGLLGMATLAGSATKIMEEYNRTISTTALLTNELGKQDIAQAQFQRLRDVANRTGQSFANLADTTPSLTIAMRANGATLTEVNDVIEGVSTSMTALGRNPQQVERAMRAIEQSFSKGRVGMEELRQQLGDALPGAFGVFAKAMGKTEAELSQMIARNEFIDPKNFIQMARVLRSQFAPALEEQMQTSQRQMTILGNAFGKLMSDLGAAGADKGLADMFKTISAAISSISPERIKAIGETLGTVFRGIGEAAGFLVRNIEFVAIALGAISFTAILAAGSAVVGMFASMFGMATRAAGGLFAYSTMARTAAAANAQLAASATAAAAAQGGVAAATAATNAAAAATAMRVVQGSSSQAVAQVATSLASAGATAIPIWTRIGGIFTRMGAVALGFGKILAIVTVAAIGLGAAFPDIAKALDSIFPGAEKLSAIIRTVFMDGVGLVTSFATSLGSKIGSAVDIATSHFKGFFDYLGEKFAWLGSVMPGNAGGGMGWGERLLRSVPLAGAPLADSAQMIQSYFNDVNKRAEEDIIKRNTDALRDPSRQDHMGFQRARDRNFERTEAEYAAREEAERRNRLPTGADILQRNGQQQSDFLKLDPITEAIREYEKLLKTLNELRDLALKNPNDNVVKAFGGIDGIDRMRQRAEDQSRDARNPRRAMNDADEREMKLIQMTVDARRIEEEALSRIKRLKEAGLQVSAQEETQIRQTVTYMDQMREAREFMRGELIQLDPLKAANKELEEFLRKLALAKQHGLSEADAADAERRYRAQNQSRLDPAGARIAELEEQTRSAARERRLGGLAGGQRAFQIALEREMDQIAKARFGTTNTAGLSDANRAELDEIRKRLEPALQQNMASAGGALYQSRVGEMREELRLAGLTTEQRQLEMQVIKQVREIEAATKQALDPNKIAELRGLIQAIDTMNKGGATGIEQWVSGTKSLRSALNDVEKNGINSLADALTDLVTDGTADFQKLGKSLLREINKAIIQSMLADLFRSSGMFGGFSLAGLFGVGAGTSGNAPSLFSGLFGLGGGAAATAGAAGAGVAQTAAQSAASTAAQTAASTAAQTAASTAAQSAPQIGIRNLFMPFGQYGLIGNLLRGGRATAPAPQPTPAPQTAAAPQPSPTPAPVPRAQISAAPPAPRSPISAAAPAPQPAPVQLQREGSVNSQTSGIAQQALPDARHLTPTPQQVTPRVVAPEPARLPNASTPPGGAADMMGNIMQGRTGASEALRGSIPPSAAQDLGLRGSIHPSTTQTAPQVSPQSLTPNFQPPTPAPRPTDIGQSVMQGQLPSFQAPIPQARPVIPPQQALAAVRSTPPVSMGQRLVPLGGRAEHYYAGGAPSPVQRLTDAENIALLRRHARGVATGPGAIENLTPEFRGRLSDTIRTMPPEMRDSVRINEAWRSNEYQAALRQRLGRGGAAGAGSSQHNFGNAVDLQWDNMTRDQQRAFQEAAARNGLSRQYGASGHWGPTVPGENRNAGAPDTGYRPWRTRGDGPLQQWPRAPGAQAPQADPRTAIPEPGVTDIQRRGLGYLRGQTPTGAPPSSPTPGTPPMPGNQTDAMAAAQQQVAEQYRQQMSQSVTQNASQLSQAGTASAQQLQTSMQSAVQQTATQIPQQVTPAVTGAITPGIQGVGDIMQSTAQAQMGQGGFWQQMMGGMGGFGGGGGGIFSMLLGGFKYGGFSDGPAPQTVSASPSAFRNAPHYDQGTPRVGGSMAGSPAILHPNEAVIPLTGGRKVPVELGPNAGNDNQRGGDTIINMVVNAKDADSFKRSEKQIKAKQAAAFYAANHAYN